MKNWLLLVVLLIGTGVIGFFAYRSIGNPLQNKLINEGDFKAEVSVTPSPQNNASSYLNAIEGILALSGSERVSDYIVLNTSQGNENIPAQGLRITEESGFDRLNEKYIEVKKYLTDQGFTSEKNNPAGLTSSYTKEIFIKNSVLCQTFLLSVNEGTGGDFGVFCADTASQGEEEDKTKQMTREEAVNIALSGSCAKEGNLKSTASFNSFSKTWWIDLDIEKEGCSPACVVYEDGRSEVNWRCTGFVNPS